MSYYKKDFPLNKFFLKFLRCVKQYYILILSNKKFLRHICNIDLVYHILSEFKFNIYTSL